MQCASNTKKFKDCLFSLCYKTPQLNTSVPHVLQKNALFLFIEMMFSCEFNRYATSVSARLHITNIKSNFTGFREIHCMSYVSRSKLVLLIKIDLLARFAIPKTRDYIKRKMSNLWETTFATEIFNKNALEIMYTQQIIIVSHTRREQLYEMIAF